MGVGLEIRLRRGKNQMQGLYIRSVESIDKDYDIDLNDDIRDLPYDSLSVVVRECTRPEQRNVMLRACRRILPHLTIMMF